MPPPLPRLYQQDQPDGMSYPYHRLDEPLPGPGSYPQLGAPPMTQQPGYMPAGTGPGGPASYPAPGRPGAVDSQQMTSPKLQRKTKGHVASACVPCKRAHLR